MNLDSRTLKQTHKKPVREVAQKFNVARSTAQRWLAESGISKSREQYEADAKKRRETAYNLRQSGLKWREVAEKMGISTANAQMLAKRYTA